MEFTAARFALILLITFHLFTHPVLSDDEEDHLLQGLNSFRQSANVPALSKHDKANCIADEIADDLEDQRCNSSTLGPRTESLANHPDALRKCNVNPNTTGGAVVLPVCVPHRVATLVLTNYTQSVDARYLNDSRFTGAGIGTDDDWTVVVLTTSTPGGSLAGSGACNIKKSGGFTAAAVMLMVLWI